MNTILANKIREAFEDEKLQFNELTSAETYDDEGTNDHFYSTYWQDHNMPEIAYFTSSFTYFTPKAFCYFLPSFLLASLDEPNSGFTEVVTEHLCPPKNDTARPSFMAWWSLLTNAQRTVVIDFLKAMQLEYNLVLNLDIEKLKAVL